MGDWANIRLHHGYDIPANKNSGKKYGQQYVGPFRITDRVGRLAYRLKLPDQWKIHPVFSMAQLEHSPDPASDPYKCLRPTEPPAIITEQKWWPAEYEIERIIARREKAPGDVEYLVRWKSYCANVDLWRRPHQINAEEMIQRYEANRQQLPKRSRSVRAVKRAAEQHSRN